MQSGDREREREQWQYEFQGQEHDRKQARRGSALTQRYRERGGREGGTHGYHRPRCDGRTRRGSRPSRLLGGCGGGGGGGGGGGVVGVMGRGVRLCVRLDGLHRLHQAPAGQHHVPGRHVFGLELAQALFAVPDAVAEIHKQTWRGDGGGGERKLWHTRLAKRGHRSASRT